MKTKIPCFDAHCDTLVYGDRLHQVRLDQERFSARGQLFAVCAEGEMQRDLTYVTRYARRLTAMPNVVLCRDGDEIGRACRRGQTAAVLSIEGAECVGCEIGLLRQAHALGARAVGLTHNRFNGLTGTCAEETDMGLTERGRAFAEAAVELDMILDISHMSDAGAGQLMAFINEPTGRICSWGIPLAEAYGVRLPRDYSGEIPPQMLIMDVPAGEYIVFEHGPFDFETQNAEVEAEIERAMKGFDYESSGYELDTTPGRVFYFYHDCKRFRKYVRPVKKIYNS